MTSTTKTLNDLLAIADRTVRRARATWTRGFFDYRAMPDGSVLIWTGNDGGRCQPETSKTKIRLTSEGISCAGSGHHALNHIAAQESGLSLSEAEVKASRSSGLLVAFVTQAVAS